MKSGETLGDVFLRQIDDHLDYKSADIIAIDLRGFTGDQIEATVQRLNAADGDKQLKVQPIGFNWLPSK